MARRPKVEEVSEFPMRSVPRSPAEHLGPRANRTIAKILEATRTNLLSRGYGGTTIDEIAQSAGVSRASFYTYFPTKRDVLLALGADSANASDELVAKLDDLDGDWTPDDMASFVDDFFALLDAHGSFAFAWTEAAHEDEELRLAGMRRHLTMCRNFGVALGRLRGQPFDDPRVAGLSAFSLTERSWSYCQLYRDKIDERAVRAEVTSIILAMLRSD